MLGLRLLAENDNGTVTVNFGSAGASPSQGGTLLGPPSTSSVTPNNNTRQLRLTTRLGGLNAGATRAEAHATDTEHLLGDDAEATL